MELKEIERSIIKKYRKEIWYQFVKAVKEFELIQENDRIAVCISGGKDSFLLAKCMQELQRHGKFHYELEFLVMNPGYTDETLDEIQNNLHLLNISAHIFDSPIFDVTDEIENPCYVCAKMRRGYLYSYAKELGCNKIALGHHFNDVIETVLLNLIYTGEFAGMMPKLPSTNFEGMELIRPLYNIREKDIISWVNFNQLKFIDCACRITKKDVGKRKKMKELTELLNGIYKEADKCIFHSIKNVNLNKVLSYKSGKEFYSFLEHYPRDINKL